MSKSALIIVDVQVDFCEGGRLAVAGGNEVAKRIYGFVHNGPRYDLIVKTRDFHDQYSDNDGHFSDHPDFVNSWPEHCTIGSPGVRLHPAVAEIPGRLFSKGYKANDYSGFQGRACGEYLDTYLRKNGIDGIDVVGIAGDYCVRQTALDGIRLGYSTLMLSSLVASVGGHPATAETMGQLVRTRRQVREGASARLASGR